MAYEYLRTPFWNYLPARDSPHEREIQEYDNRPAQIRFRRLPGNPRLPDYRVKPEKMGPYWRGVGPPSNHHVHGICKGV